jgi:hypothetical protein
VNSQSLKDICSNKFVLKDSVYSSNIDSLLTKKGDTKKEIKKGDFATISTGLFVASEYRWRDNNVPYTSFDLNINVGSIVYLDLGIYGLHFSNKTFFAGHIALGAGFDIIPDKLFTYAGLGGFTIFPYTLSGFLTLRVNYKFTKNLSAGLDNKFYYDGNSEDLSLYLYSIGLNFSYRFNY